MLRPLMLHEIDEEARASSLVYTFGGVEPVATLLRGTDLRTSTLDCFAGLVRRAEDLPSVVCDPRYLNPQTGPFYVEGARPGDTLAVHFASIEPRHDWGVSSTVPFFGALTASRDTALLHEALPERTWIYDLDSAEGQVHFRALDSGLTVPLPLDPMHGTVGVAPPLGEVRSSLTPGSWGGNMDTPEMRAGATCYLGVNVEGALLSFGDGHARQGEGESCGVAVECAMDTTLRVDVVSGVVTPWPRIETDDHWMTTGSAKPLEDAFRIAHTQMVRWLEDLLDLSTMDAYQLVAQVALTPVANVCDTVYTVVCKVPKAFFPGVVAMHGVHDALRRP
ncbi:acetamidase/formamidase [Nocardioides daedukensis]|uniref:Acetamidase/formamidase n=1 Tax=Nocardioides daedukensis TaxID=634462 RepID=A0A7Y9UM42_9ACTN|nr:acetamidase/formamidase family protein [Nocardioides daedukensis]NYG57133.1 acetamidase/formamidase [Nocardioides daedukensis]